MPDGTVDNLNIQVSADADQASKSLNSLVSTLNSVDREFSKNISGLRKFSKEIGVLSSSLKTLSGIKISSPDLSGMTKLIDTLNKFDAGKAKSAADGIESVAKSFGDLSKTNFNDSGINKTLRAVNKLFRADFGKFNPDDFQKITNSISALGNMPDVSSSVNRFVSSLSRLANAGEKTGQSANGILRLGQQTKEAAKQLQSVGTINEDVNLFVQSIGRLASAGAKTSQTASGLNSLAKETLEFFKAMQNAPKVSENTIRMTQALAQLATAGGKVGTSTNTITSAFNKLSSVGSKTMSVMRKVASGITSAFKQIGSSSSGLTKAQFSLGNLLKTAIGFRLGYGLLNFGKQAFELGSDITEVENVVNVAFGSMASQAYEFASTAKERFGLSELAALNYAGTMKAVLNSSGVAQEAAAEMSTSLAGLAGDLASFYNISQDVAWDKIMSGMAGEVEPLRRLGINLSVANLESYALSQGITESYQSMTQAEQVMLRYNYLMAQTAQQQGDFARTSGSFANQLRLLTLNFQQLAATIGQGFIAAVLPAIQALNALMSVLQRAAEAFRDFMYVLTGYDGKGSQSGIVSELQGMEGASSGLEDVSGSMDDTTDSAKKLKKALSVLPFDQLNQLNDNTQDAGGGGGTGGDDLNVPGSGIGNVDSIYDALGSNKLPNAINEWAERIRKAFIEHDWNDLGYQIAWGINKGLKAVYDAINWNKVGPKITAFTSAFTQTFNSFVSNLRFDMIGRVVGAGINTVVNTFNQLFGEDGINFALIGFKISSGLRAAIDEINWLELGKALGNYFMISWDTFIGFVNNMSVVNLVTGLNGWEELGLAIADSINGAFESISLEDIGTAIGKFVAGILDMLRSAISNIEWGDIATEIKNGLFNALTSASNNGENNSILAAMLGVGAVATIVKLLEPISKALSVISGVVNGMNFSGLATAIAGVSGPAALLVAGLAALVGGLAAVFASNEEVREGFFDATDAIVDNFEPALSFLTDDIIPDLNKGWKNFTDLIKPLTSFLKTAFTSVWEDMINPALSYLGKTILPTVISTAKNLWKNVFVPLANFIDSVLTPIFEIVSDVLKILWKTIIVPLSKFISGVFSSAFEGITKIVNTLVIPAINEAIDVFQFLWKNVFSPIISFLRSTFGPAFETVFSGIGDLISNLQGLFQGLINFITGIFSRDWSQAWQGIVDAFSSIMSGIETLIKTPINAVLKLIKKFVNGIIGGVNWVLKKVGSDNRLDVWEGVYLKKGSDGLPQNTLGIVNDQRGSTYRELIVPPSGRPFIPKGRNVMLPLQKGTKILPANETKELMRFSGVPKFSGGIGDFISGAWSAIKNFTGDVWDYITNPGDILNVALDKFVSFGDLFEPWIGLAGGIVNKTFDGIKNYIKGIFDKLIPKVDYNPSAGVEQWRSLAAKALRMEGQYSPSNLNLMLFQMQTESSGNPNAINNWDINAKRGTPSKGLMQVIDPTFRAYARPGYNSNIWDPLSNMLASIRYTVRRYGSLARGWRGHGYAEGIGTITWSDLMGGIPFLAKGGLITSPTLAFTGENFRKEAVLPLENRRTMGMIADSIVSNSSGGLGLSKAEIQQAVAEGVVMAMMNNQGNQPNITVYAELKTENDEVLARAVTRGQQKIDYRMNPVGT